MSTPVPDFPTRGETADQLKQLIDGVIDRGKASAWAVSWLMRSDEFRVSDFRLLDAIMSLGAADLISTDRPYLYDTSDFEQWLTDLKNGS